MSRFLAELKRRRVPRAAAFYIAAAWAAVQVVATISPALDWASWVLRATLVVCLLGFPVALALAWLFDVRGGGIHREAPAVESAAGAGAAARVALAAVLLLVLGGAGWAAFSGVRTAAHDGATIAVIPFADLAGGPGGKPDAYLADGISDAMLTSLSRVQSLRVISEGSAAKFAGVETTTREIGDALGADYLLRGSVQREGGRLRVNARLIDARTERQLWADSYDREMSSVFAIESDIARRVAHALELRLTDEQRQAIEAVPAASLDAYELYLRGRQYQDARRKEETEVAIDFYRRALAADPTYAPAAVGLADCFYRRAYEYGESSAWLDSAVAAASRAVALDHDLATARRALGGAQMALGRMEEARASLEKAVELNPSDALALSVLGAVAFQDGRVEEGIRRLKAGDLARSRDRARQPLQPWRRLLRDRTLRRRAGADRAGRGGQSGRLTRAAEADRPRQSGAATSSPRGHAARLCSRQTPPTPPPLPTPARSRWQRTSLAPPAATSSAPTTSRTPRSAASSSPRSSSPTSSTVTATSPARGSCSPKCRRSRTPRSTGGLPRAGCTTTSRSRRRSRAGRPMQADGCARPSRTAGSPPIRCTPTPRRRRSPRSRRSAASPPSSRTGSLPSDAPSRPRSRRRGRSGARGEIIQRPRQDPASPIVPPNRPDDRSGHAHRQLIGYVGLALPILLLIVAAARPTPELRSWPPLDSVSAYYYTGAVAIFTGLLVALSLLLLTYRGYDNEWGAADRWIARIGGIAAFCVAFFPTKPPDGLPEPPWWDPAANVVHYVSATALFATFIVFSLWLFRKTAKGEAVTDEKRRRNRIYVVCGAVMIAAVLWAGSSNFTGAPIFLPESIALVAFAFSWLTKGRAGVTAVRAAKRAKAVVTPSS